MSPQLQQQVQEYQARLKSTQAAVENRKNSYDALITQMKRREGEKMVWIPTKWLQSWITGEPSEVWGELETHVHIHAVSDLFCPSVIDGVRRNSALPPWHHPTILSRTSCSYLVWKHALLCRWRQTKHLPPFLLLWRQTKQLLLFLLLFLPPQPPWWSIWRYRRKNLPRTLSLRQVLVKKTSDQYCRRPILRCVRILCCVLAGCLPVTGCAIMAGWSYIIVYTNPNLNTISKVWTAFGYPWICVFVCHCQISIHNSERHE